MTWISRSPRWMLTGGKDKRPKAFKQKKTTKVDIVNYDFDDEGGA